MNNTLGATVLLSATATTSFAQETKTYQEHVRKAISCIEEKGTIESNIPESGEGDYVVTMSLDNGEIAKYVKSYSSFDISGTLIDSSGELIAIEDKDNTVIDSATITRAGYEAIGGGLLEPEVFDGIGFLSPLKLPNGEEDTIPSFPEYDLRAEIDYIISHCSK